MRLIPIRQYNKATATVALLLCMASSFSPLRVSADQYSRYLAEDGSEQVTALDSGTEQVTALATDSQQVAASESGGKEITATELASDEIKATGVEVTDLEIDEAATQADGLEEEVAATDYIYIIEDPHMSMSTDPPVLPPTYGKGSVEGYYYYHHAKGKGGSMKSKSKSKSKSKKHKSSAYYDDEYYVDPDYSKGKGEGAYYDDEYYVDPDYSKGKGEGAYYDDEYYVDPDYSKGKGKGKGAFYDDEYYHVETTAPKTHIPTDMPAHSEDSSVDEPDPSVPPEEEDQASQLPTTLPSTVNGEGHYVEYGYKVGKHKKSHEYYYTEPEYVYHEPEEPEYVEEIPKYVFQKPIYHYPVYPSKSMKSHKMKSTKTYYSVGEVPTSKGKGYYPAAPTAAKGKGKGYYPSPTSPATKHTPAPDGSKKASRSPVPPSSPSPASIPQQSIPGGTSVSTSDSAGETITMAEYWLSYEVTSTNTPTSAMQVELEKVTADYVKNFFESNFAMSSVIHFTGATTSLLSSTYPEYPTPPAKVRFQTALDFAASSSHPQVAETEGPSQYDDALRIAFEGTNAKSYLYIVNLLPDGNVYRTATSVSFEFGSFTEQTAKMVTVPQTAGTVGSTNTITETTTAGIPGAPNASTSTTTTTGINTAGIAAAAGAGFFVLLVAGLVVHRNKRSKEDGRVQKYLSGDDCGHITVAEETYTGTSSNDSQSCVHQSSPSRDFGRSLPTTEEETTGREHSSSVSDTVSDKGDDDESSEDSCSCVLEDEEV